jgi:hypothetical protein
MAFGEALCQGCCCCWLVFRALLDGLPPPHTTLQLSCAPAAGLLQGAGMQDSQGVM